MAGEDSAGRVMADGGRGLEWFLVMTHPREERRALENLEGQGFSCCLPLYRAERLRRGRRVVVVEPLFPRYLFVALDWASGQSAKLRSTRGVMTLVRFGTEPARVPSGLVASFLRREEEAHRFDEVAALYRAGDRVRVLEGPFRGLEGVFTRISGEERVMILLKFMGQEVACPLQVTAIESL